MKITIPHIHKIEGEAGFWSRVTKTGEIKELKINVLEGLRQIEGIVIGRKAQEVPLIISRICGICPIVHILNACLALEKALEIQVSPQTVLLRKLFLASQIVHSHTLHLFFMSLADFFDIENDLDLIKRFPKETKASLFIRDFALKVARVIGGREVHPITPKIGGFSKVPKKENLQKLQKEIPGILDLALFLAKTFKNLSYSAFKRKTNFVSIFSKEEYAFYQSPLIFTGREKISIGDFYSDKIEEDLKAPPLKSVRYERRPYMVGAIARLKNNSKLLNPKAKKLFEEFKQKHSLNSEDFFGNIYHNLFSQIVEVLHFLEESQNLINEILKSGLKAEKNEFKITKGSGLSAMEAPRGTLFTYFEIDSQGRILSCNIITPTAQFLANLEEDLKVLLPKILNLSEKERKRKIRSLIRVYDPCISCATH